MFSGSGRVYSNSTTTKKLAKFSCVFSTADCGLCVVLCAQWNLNWTELKTRWVPSTGLFVCVCVPRKKKKWRKVVVVVCTPFYIFVRVLETHTHGYNLYTHTLENLPYPQVRLCVLFFDPPKPKNIFGHLFFPSLHFFKIKRGGGKEKKNGGPPKISLNGELPFLSKNSVLLIIGTLSWGNEIGY